VPGFLLAFPRKQPQALQPGSGFMPQSDRPAIPAIPSIPQKPLDF